MSETLSESMSRKKNVLENFPVHFVVVRPIMSKIHYHDESFIIRFFIRKSFIRKYYYERPKVKRVVLIKSITIRKFIREFISKVIYTNPCIISFFRSLSKIHAFL